MKASEILFGFKEQLKAHGRSEATVKAYCEHAESFLKTIGLDAKAVTRKTLEAYLAGLRDHKTKEGKPYKPGTISVKIRSIKRLFEYLEKANLVFINPAEHIKEPKKERRLPRNILSPAEAREILDQPNLGTLKGLRDRAVLELFYGTGIRLSELCELTIFDVDLKCGQLRINKGKGKKDRVIPMGKHAIKFLKEYISKVRPNFAKKNRAERKLFIDARGNPLSKQMAGISVKACARAAGIKKQVTPHTFRHTFAAQLVKNGADIISVQKMLGHASLEATQQYLKATGINVKEAHKKSHPREKDKEKETAAQPKIETKRGANAKRKQP